MGLFGKKLSPKEQVRQWKRGMRHEMRAVDRQITAIKREQKGVEREIKQCAKSGDVVSAKILAKEYVRANKAVERLYTSKAQMNSVIMSMEANLAMAKVTGCLQSSTEVMAMMNSLVRVNEISQVMMAMSKEMTKAGIIEEMVDDTFEMMEDDELEDEAEDAVNSVLAEITDGVMGEMAGIATGSSLPEAEPAAAEEEGEDDMADMQARLAALQA
ncbi:charged multivesicular body protein 3 [Thecamonas trahens ATCC 50062]|uniref:Charged multivesicular body protein 3 n=1 Tax=Thecamonas trahens ATCC 50062 TaxID=461836 RepID=A0A0L0DVR5_THETB|nr:charged multivesicular body protein 3 [Thecamonas trahens ATCC 50062]KNC56272.1 charged multivesicular body protein 3 [Thecamonas trahens ATCC 50062]|eukprot:XP_013760791.1 charged multivesicular body protein 3 [Thecamonas trahens ATCC 50062]